MNVWQLANQIKFLVLKAKWKGTGDKMLASTHVTGLLAERSMAIFRLPMAIVRIGGASPDDDHPGLWTQAFEVQLIVEVAGDAIGENAFLGANRSGGFTSSLGRGILEFEPDLFAATGILNLADGININARGRGAALGESIGEDENTYAASRKYAYDAQTTEFFEYNQPTKMTAVDAAGAGDADLTWVLPPDRFDFNNESTPLGPFGLMILRRAAGGTPPSGPTDGTGVTLSGSFATSVTDSPGAGGFSYALFAGYDDDKDSDTEANIDNVSAAVTKTVTVT